MRATSSARQPRQLHLVDDTVLREDARLAHPAPPVRQPSPCTPCSSTVDSRVVEIEKRRKAVGLSLHEFLKRADVPSDTWRDLRRGRRRPLLRTILKLNAALVEPRITRPSTVIAAFHRLVMTLIAPRLGIEPATVFATDFSVQRPMNPQWKVANEVRSIAIYITAVELQVDNPDIAAALGITRQAVKKARDKVEDWRDDADRDALIESIAVLAAGR